MARWLRRRSRQAPPWRWLSMRLIPPRCLFCGQSADLGAIDLCSDCLVSLPIADNNGMKGSFIVPFVYAPPVDAALRALKFQGDLCPAKVFGALLAAAAVRAAGPPLRAALPTLIVPVPLHGARLHERGFNQSAALAQAAALWLHRPTAPTLLQRSRPTQPQTSLPADARRRNVAGAFRPSPGARAWLQRHPGAADHIALVDDVLTTGATTAAAASALRECGARRVSIWAVAQPMSDSLTSHGVAG